ncbi:VWD domain-containing protein [Microbacterium jejuense]|uniref:VWD domain-containing protein n=1 Tax=Microbacterium jejuense TaxID=1263637 RepID=UPI0031E88156
MGRRLGTVVITAALVAGMTACFPAPGPEKDAADPTPTSGAVTTTDVQPPVEDWEPSTRTEQLLTEIDASLADGGTTAQQAIDAFALYFDDVPGASPSALPDGDGPGLTYTLQLMEQHRSELTPEQVARLDAAHGVPDPDEAPASLTSLVQPVTGWLPPSDERARLRRLVALAMKDWRQYQPGWGELVPHLLYSDEVVDVPLMEGAAAASAELSGSASGVCDITVYRDGVEPAADDDWWRYAFAHELFHCYQQIWRGDLLTEPSWVIEGSAVFASLDLHRGEPIPDGVVGTDWFSSQSKPLPAFSYDAWPIFETFHQAKGEPYGAVRHMLEAAAHNTASALRAGGMDALPFRLRMATASSRFDEFHRLFSIDPTQWDLAWPSGNTHEGPRDNRIDQPALGVGEITKSFIDSFAHNVHRFTFTADVGLVTIAAQSTLLGVAGEADIVTIADGTSKTFCVDASQCRCPDDTTSDTIPLDERAILLAMAAGDEQHGYAIKTQKWDPDTRCEKPKPNPKTAGTHGDPHIRTFDGLSFDVMTRGEFVVARDTAGGFEVQGRHEAVSRSETAPAGNSAIAITAAGHRFTFTAAEFALDAEVTVRADGEPRADARFTVAGVRVEHSDIDGYRAWTVTLPDSSTVTLVWGSWFFVDLALTPERAARTVGLVGSADDDATNDLRLPDGSLLPAGANIETDFAEKWWVDAATSLFDYAPGTSALGYRAPAPPVTEFESRFERECADALGPRATRDEVAECALDLAFAELKATLDMYAKQIGARVDREDIEWVQVPEPAPEPLPDPLSVVRPVAGAPTLAMTARAAESDDGPLDTRAVAVPRGALLLARTADCDAAEIWVEVGDNEPATDDLPVRIPLCGDRPGFDNYSGTQYEGEGYAFTGPAGDRRFELHATSDTLPEVRVDVYVDPTPTIVDQAAIDAKHGFAGALDGVGDAVLLLPDVDHVATWPATGLDTVCLNIAYGGSLDDDVWVIEPRCRHTDALTLSVNRLSEDVGVEMPVLLFRRDAGSTRVEIDVPAD